MSVCLMFAKEAARRNETLCQRGALLMACWHFARMLAFVSVIPPGDGQ